MLLWVFCTVIPAFSQLMNQDAILVYKDGGITHKFPFFLLDSISYSQGDDYSISRQNFHTSDSVYSLDLAAIDSVSVYTPSVTDRGETYRKYVETASKIRSMVKSGLITNVSQLIEEAGKYSNFSFSESLAGGAFLYFAGGWKLQADFSGAGAGIAEPQNTDSNQYEGIEEDIRDLLSIEIGSSNSEFDPPALTRASVDHKQTYRILVWAPWGTEDGFSAGVLSRVRKICETVNAKSVRKVFLTTMVGGECTLSSLATFGKYDMVVITTHGNPQGYMCLPVGFGGLDGSEPGVEFSVGVGGESVMLSNSIISRHLPSSLSKTVIWTAMCYAHVSGSATRALMARHGAADYFGATDVISDAEAVKGLQTYLYTLFSGAISADAFKNYARSNWSPYRFTCDGVSYSGSYGHNITGNIYYPLHYVRQANNGINPKACWQAPPGEIEKVISGYGKFKMGIMVQNVATGSYLRIEANEDDYTILSSDKREYNDIIEGYSLAFSVKELKSGSYRYWSYIMFEDGNYTYSDDYGTFEVSDTGTIYLCYDITSENYPDLELNEYYDDSEIFGYLPFVSDISLVEGPAMEISRDDYYGDIQMSFRNYGKYIFKIDYLVRPEWWGDYLKSMEVTWEFSKAFCGGWLDLDEVSIGDFNKYFTEDKAMINKNVRKVRSKSGNVSSYLSGEMASEIKNGTVYLSPHTSFSLSRLQNLESVSVDGKDIFAVIQSCDNLRDIRISGLTREETRFSSIDSLVNLDLPDYTGEIFLRATELQTVNLPQVREIGLPGCTLKELSFPSARYVIQSGFEGCETLEHILLPRVEIIGWYAFENCTSLKEIDYPQCLNIGHCSFKGCEFLRQVNLPRVQEIESMAFDECYSLEKASMPEVLTIDFAGFSSCSSLNSVDMANVRTIGKMAFYETALTEVEAPLASEIGHDAFEYCSAIETVKIDNVESLGASAFAYCESLKEARLPKVRSLLGRTFMGCTAIDRVEAPIAVKIESECFKDCASLKSVTIDSVTTIGSSAFEGCESLETLDLPATVTSLPSFHSNKFRKVICRAPEPPDCYPYRSPFGSGVRIYVPRASLRTYQLAWGFNDNEIDVEAVDVFDENGSWVRRCNNIFPL